MARASQSYETRHTHRQPLGMHRHAHAYAALVLDGEHVECSVDGPVHCAPGTLLLHPCFHAHANRFGKSGARVLNLRLPPASAPKGGLRALQVPASADAARILRHADLRALRALIEASVPQTAQSCGWQRAMLEALAASDEPIARVARRLGVSAAHASRALVRTYGFGPQALRRELRWRHALALLERELPLAEIAATAGFADQSHFSRVARGCSGMPPGRLRRRIKCVQDGCGETAA